MEEMKFRTATEKYLTSKQFASLSCSTQKGYEYKLTGFCKDSLNGRTLGNISVKNINAVLCTQLYDQWEEESSTSNANHCSRIFSVLMNHLVSQEYIPNNPMARVKKRTSTPRSVTWSHDQVISFLDMAFTKFEWRNIGLIVMMCYEWAQRPIDIRNLTWDKLKLDEKIVTITQTKRGATVELPIPEHLEAMLTQQEEDWGFQPYVVPNHRASDGAYRALNVSQMTHLLKQVKDAVGLPDELQVGDLRKTVIVQMIASEVDHLAIQSVTGHKHVSSLDPYNKFRLSTAKSALDRRIRQ